MPPRAPPSTVLKAAKACFSAIVEVSGIVIAREETAVRPERLGLKVSEILADAGDTVTARANAGRLTLPEGGLQWCRPPSPGHLGVVGVNRARWLGQGRSAVFHHRAQRIRPGCLVPTENIAKLAANQAARIKIIGAGEVDGKVRRVATTVETQQPARPGLYRADDETAACW